jgi:hypothetical protein
MGTRINILFEHDFADWQDRQATLAKLDLALPAAQSLAAYWASKRQTEVRKHTWVANPIFPPSQRCDYMSYSGPGELFVNVNAKMIHVHTGGRWRGFLSIQDLRDAHYAAFVQLAQAFGAKEFFCCADNDLVMDIFYGGGELLRCIELLESELGPSLAYNSIVDYSIAKETEHGCPRIWYHARVD